MSSSAGGPLGALLMIAPLAAIPVLAVVGVPQFVPVVASSTDDEPEVDVDQSAEEPPATARPRRPGAGDLFAPLEEGSAERSPDRPRRPPVRAPGVQSDRRALPRPAQRTLAGPPPEDLDGYRLRAQPRFRGARSGAVDGPLQDAPDDDGRVVADEFTPGLVHPLDENSRAAVDRPARRGPNSPAKFRLQDQAEWQPGGDAAMADGAHADPEPTPAPEQTGWANAAARLRQLGIRRHQLDPRTDGSSRVRFVFTCYVASGDGSRVVQHFSHAGDTPLEAIEATLDAVEQWRAEVAAGQPDDVVSLE